MGTLVKVRFKVAWQNYRAGDVIEPPGTLRDWLLANGYAERLPPPAAPTPADGPAESEPTESASTPPPAPAGARRRRA